MSRKNAIALLVSTAAVVAFCALIFYFSGQPSVESDGMSLGVADIVARVLVPGFDAMSPAEQQEAVNALNHPIRKTAHFTEYAVLGMLMFNLVWRIEQVRIEQVRAEHARAAEQVRVETSESTRRTLVAALGAIAWAAATLYAMTDELHQSFVSGRACMFTDVCIDSAGALAGVVIVAAIFCTVRHCSRRRRERANAQVDQPVEISR